MCADHGPPAGTADSEVWHCGKGPAAPYLRDGLASGLGPPAQLTGHGACPPPRSLGLGRTQGWAPGKEAERLSSTHMGLQSPHWAAPHLQPASAPMSSTVWGHNDLYLDKAQPKGYLILHMINQHKDLTSLVVHLMGTQGPLQATGHPGPPSQAGLCSSQPMGRWPSAPQQQD